MQEKRVPLVTGGNKVSDWSCERARQARCDRAAWGAKAGGRRESSGGYRRECAPRSARPYGPGLNRRRSRPNLHDFGRLDLLINNAGISRARAAGTFQEAVSTNLLTASPLVDVRTVFETNVFGMIAVTQAMLPLLRESPAGRIVLTASSGGSVTLNSDPTNSHRNMFANYSVSKTAAHGVTLAFALAPESTNIKVNAACPGFTSTALNNFNGTRSVEEGARERVRFALVNPDGPTGVFAYENGPVPW